MTFDERKKVRQMHLAGAAITLRERFRGLPGSDPMFELLVVALGAEAGNRALMHALLAKGLITERERQDFLDAGTRDLCDQVHGQATKIGVLEGAGRA
jgi:hypothetical protein